MACKLASGGANQDDAVCEKHCVVADAERVADPMIREQDGAAAVRMTTEQRGKKPHMRGVPPANGSSHTSTLGSGSSARRSSSRRRSSLQLLRLLSFGVSAGALVGDARRRCERAK